jgi:GNAT superfamily N-acetyltransferase
MLYNIREIVADDYNHGYFELMFEFSNYRKNVSKEEFETYIRNRDRMQIHVLEDISGRMIGVGTIFKIEKLHNNPIGQIEDVIITEAYRKHGLGSKLIERLTEIGLREFKCYKIVLNCLDKNIGFYEKSGFTITGVQMRKLS